MATTTIDVNALPAQFAEALALAAAGGEVIITEGDVRMARLVPLPVPGQPRVLGLHPGAIETTPDFDAPLPDDFWAGTP